VGFEGFDVPAGKAAMFEGFEGFEGFESYRLPTK
jgi:hypothetical protein